MSDVKEITNKGVELECDDSSIVGRGELPTNKDVDFKALYEEVKKESIARKEKLKEITSEKSLLEEKIKEYDDMIKKENEQKEQEINKLRNEFEPISKEVEQLRALKADLEQREKTRRENLINEIKTISQNLKDDSYLTIAEALPDSDKLELFLRSISQGREKIPVYNSKLGGSPKPAGEAINPDSLLDLQKLYKEDRTKYNELVATKRNSS